MTPRELMRFYDGELEGAERERAEQALARDEAAQSSLAGLEQVGDFVRATAERPNARVDAIAERVMASLDVHPERRGFRNGALSAAAGALAIAAAAMLMQAEAAWRQARSALHNACIELGCAAVDTAALAQPVTVTVDWRAGSIVGVATPRLHASIGSFIAHYGPATTTASLDRAGLEFTQLIPALVRLAQEDEAVRNLQAALRKTVRRLQALEQLVIPQLDREARAVAAALEEEERDDAVRARRWLTQRSDAQF